MNLDLDSQLSSLRSRIPKEEWRYFFLDNFDNLIFHLQRIPSDRTRNRIGGELMEYLKLVEQELAAGHSNRLSFKSLYSQKFYQLSTFYEEELNFIHKPYYPLTVTLFVAYFFLLYWLFHFKIALPVWAVSAIGYAIYIRGKLKRRRYY